MIILRAIILLRPSFRPSFWLLFPRIANFAVSSATSALPPHTTHTPYISSISSVTTHTTYTTHATHAPQHRAPLPSPQHVARKKRCCCMDKLTH